MLKISLPSFVKEWSADGHVILVWKRDALLAVKSSPLLKYKHNVTNLDHIIKDDNIFRIVVFDSKPNKRLVSNTQLYGGAPTLVVDISSILYADVVDFCSKRENVLAFNIPFWMHYFKVVDEHTNVVELLSFLVEGNNDIANKEELRKLEECTRLSEEAQQDFCSCCFACNGGNNVIKPCGHYACAECVNTKRECLNTQHKKEFNLGFVDEFTKCSNVDCNDSYDREISCQQCHLYFYCSRLCRELHCIEHRITCDIFNLYFLFVLILLTAVHVHFAL